MNFPVIPGGFPSKYYFDGAPKAGTSGQVVSTGLPEAIEQVRTAPGSSQPCPGDMAACSIFAGVTAKS
jgi:hypothetical protein